MAVVKAQIHAGGRGKGGGVKIATSADEADQLAANIGDDAGHAPNRTGRAQVGRLLVEQGVDIKKELCLSILVEAVEAPWSWLSLRAAWRSKRSRNNPEKKMREKVHPAMGSRGSQVGKLAFGLGLGGADRWQGVFPIALSRVCRYRCFAVRNDLLVVTGDAG